MDITTLIILFLVLLIIGREIFFQIVLNRLINKHMSRNFHEYQMGLNVSGPKKQVLKKEVSEPFRDASEAAVEMGL